MTMLKPGFHVVVTGRWVSLTVFRGHWSSGSLGITASRWRSFRVVGGRQRYCFVLFPYDTNETTGSLAVFDRHSRSLR